MESEGDKSKYEVKPTLEVSPGNALLFKYPKVALVMVALVMVALVMVAMAKDSISKTSIKEPFKIKGPSTFFLPSGGQPPYKGQ